MPDATPRPFDGRCMRFEAISSLIYMFRDRLDTTAAPALPTIGHAAAAALSSRNSSSAAAISTFPVACASFSLPEVDDIGLSRMINKADDIRFRYFFLMLASGDVLMGRQAWHTITGRCGVSAATDFAHARFNTLRRPASPACRQRQRCFCRFYSGY